MFLQHLADHEGNKTLQKHFEQIQKLSNNFMQKGLFTKSWQN